MSASMQWKGRLGVPYQGSKNQIANWVDTRDYPVFVSEYNAPDGFTPIWTHGKFQLMHAKGANGKVIERVYVADRYADRYQTDLFLGLKENT